MFLVFGFVNAAIFTLIERRGENHKTTSDRMLDQLRKNFTKHHNFSDEEFEYFTMASYNAVRTGLSLDWTYFRAVDFTYTAMTTIGESLILDKAIFLSASGKKDQSALF